MEEPGELQSVGSQRVGHNWVTSLSLSRSKINHDPLHPIMFTSREREKKTWTLTKEDKLQSSQSFGLFHSFWAEKIRYLGLTNFKGSHKIMFLSSHYKYVMYCTSILCQPLLSTLYSWLHLFSTITPGVNIYPFYRQRRILNLKKIRTGAKILIWVYLTQNPRDINHEAFTECLSAYHQWINCTDHCS